MRADKLREVKDGHDGTWVAHPGLVPVARADLRRAHEGPEPARSNLREDVKVGQRGAAGRAARARAPRRACATTSASASSTSSRLARGPGCVPLYNLMEDAATAEISRAQVWQWIHHGATLDDGRHVTAELFRKVLAEEIAQLRVGGRRRALRRERFAEACELFERLSTTPTFEEFLTLPAYEALNRGVLMSDCHPMRSSSHVRRDSLLPALSLRRHAISSTRGASKGSSAPTPQTDVEKLRGSVRIEHTLARVGRQAPLGAAPHGGLRPRARRADRQPGRAEVRAGLKAIYLSGWQVAADANSAGQMYPDQSLYPVDSVPHVVRAHQRRAPPRRPDRARRGQG